MSFESQEEYDAYVDALTEAEYMEQAAIQHEYDMFIASQIEAEAQAQQMEAEQAAAAQGEAEYLATQDYGNI
jgi:hypothetical protein